MAPVKMLPRVRGRIANRASTPRNLAKTIAEIMVMWSIFFGILPMAVYKVEEQLGLAHHHFASRRWSTPGAALFLLGGAIGCVCAAFMVVHGEGTPLPADSTRKLVVAGPYRYIRNPMAMSSFGQGIAVGLFLGSPLVVIYTLIGAVGWNYLVRPWEEYDMEERFGAEYVRYRAGVPCWIPRLTPYK